jgi:protein-tyrosine kinase
MSLVHTSLVERTLQRVRGTMPQASARSASRSDAETTAATNDGGGQRLTHGIEGALVVRNVEISLAALRAAGLLAPEDEGPQMEQQYRRIKRPLIVNASGRGAARLPNGHVIMVASAMPGEGKTFTAINLALSMSREKDVHVLLVDADVAKAHISRLFAVAEAPGLLDVLRDSQVDVESVILPTDVPNLSVLPAGSRSRETTELLASTRMEAVMSAIAQLDERRVAVVDSPPLLLTTESHAIAQVAGQVVMVVRAGETPQHAVLAALSYLGEHPVVSLVLNQCTVSVPANYYYGYPEQSPAK